MNKNYCYKKIQPQKYNGEETVKIKELHHVNQWYDNKKHSQSMTVSYKVDF